MAATETVKTVNYTDEMVERMVAMYQELGNEGLEAIAQDLDKSVRSIRSKLVREGVYIASPKGKSTVKADTGPTKKELLNELESLVGFNTTPLAGATKNGLKALIEFAKTKEA